MGATLERARTFHTLDALRGIAALVVVTPHAIWLMGDVLFLSAFIAVDMFFILSGFVLMHAYDSRLNRGMSAIAFLRLRIIRLYPLYLLGLLVALIATGVNILVGAQNLTPEMQIAALLNLAMLPSPSEDPGRVLYVFNFPAWSLLFELIVNVAFAAFGFRLSMRGLLVLIGVAGMAVVALAWHYQTLNIGTGWSTFFGGLARAFFGFFVGVLLYKLHKLRGDKGAQSSLAVLALCAVAFATFLPGLRVEQIGYYKFIVLTLLLSMTLYPALIWFAARVEPGNALTPLCAFLGVTSYAVYALHVPLGAAVWTVAHLTGVSLEAYAPLSGAVFVLGVLAIAWLADKYWDAPLRAWLSGLHLGRKRAPA